MSAASIKTIKGQKYAEIKKVLAKSGSIFTDLEFPSTNKSVFHSKVDEDIEWKRPAELCKVPRLIVEGVTSDDLHQGEYGNAWFVTACSSIISNPKLFSRVVPKCKEQEWMPEQQHQGIFHFQFWRHGDWLDVVIDDQLPTKDNKLLFCHAADRNEFWSALLEKAYAKALGDYESLSYVDVADALVDFTGGMSHTLFLEEFDKDDDNAQNSLFSLLKYAEENDSMIVCSIECDRDDVGNEEDYGLLLGYGYCGTAVRCIDIPKGLQSTVGSKQLKMLRLQNPWGLAGWKGPWSDHSDEWKSLTPDERNSLGLNFTKEAEFWVSYADFLNHFNRLDIIYFMNTSLFSLKKTWNEAVFKGKWTSGPRGSDKARAGGNSNHETFLENPQFMFDVTGDRGDTLLISLEQDDRNVERKSGGTLHNIGFEILKVEENRQYRVHRVDNLVDKSPFRQRRSAFLNTDLPKGRYVVIPSTLMPSCDGGFLLRMYSNDKLNAKELTAECPKQPLLACLGKPPSLVAVVTAVKGTSLEKKVKGTTDPFVIMRCEKESVRTPVVKGSVDPQWGTKAIFYKKNPSSPIFIELYNSNTLRDDFMGMATINQLSTEEGEEIECDLLGKSKKEKDINVKYQGTITVKLQSSLDLTDL